MQRSFHITQIIWNTQKKILNLITLKPSLLYMTSFYSWKQAIFFLYMIQNVEAPKSTYTSHWSNTNNSIGLINIFCEIMRLWRKT